MGSIVERVLDHRGLRRGWFARKLGISDGYLSQLLSGHRSWTAELKEKAAFWLGVPEDMLFFEADCSQGLQNVESTQPVEAVTHDATDAGA